MTAQKFNERLRAHRKSLNNPNYKNESKLSEYIWSLKDKNIDYEIKWELIRKSRSYEPGMWYCPLCNLEKYYILMGNKDKMVNSRSELMSKCLHKRKFLMDKVDTNDIPTKPTRRKKVVKKPTRIPSNIEPSTTSSTHNVRGNTKRINTLDIPSTHNTRGNIELQKSSSIDTLDIPSTHNARDNIELRKSTRIRKPKIIMNL